MIKIDLLVYLYYPETMDELIKKKAIAFANAHNILDEHGMYESYHFKLTTRLLVELDQFRDPLILDLIRFSVDAEDYDMDKLSEDCIPLVKDWLTKNVKDRDLWFECLTIAPRLVEICPDIHKHRLEVARRIGRFVDICHFPEQFRSDKDYMMQALDYDPEYFELASPNLKNDPEFRKEARSLGYKNK